MSDSRDVLASMREQAEDRGGPSEAPTDAEVEQAAIAIYHHMTSHTEGEGATAEEQWANVLRQDAESGLDWAGHVRHVAREALRAACSRSAKATP